MADLFDTMMNNETEFTRGPADDNMYLPPVDVQTDTSEGEPIDLANINLARLQESFGPAAESAVAEHGNRPGPANYAETATLGANSFLWSLPEAAWGPLMGASSAAINAASGSEKPTGEAYMEGVQKGKDQWTGMRDDLGRPATMATELGFGMLSGKTAKDAIDLGIGAGGKKLSEFAQHVNSRAIGDKVFDTIFGKGKGYNTKWAAPIVRSVKQAVSSGAENVLQHAAIDPEAYRQAPLVTASGDFTSAAVFGGVMQGMAGELLPMGAKWMGADWDKAEIMKFLMSKGVGPNEVKGVNPKNMTSAVANAGPNQGLFDLDNIGGVDQSVNLSNFSDALMDINFHSYDPSLGQAMGPEAMGGDLVRGTADAMNIYADIGDTITKGWQDAVANPLGTRQQWDVTQHNLSASRAAYEKMFEGGQKGPNGQPAGGDRPVNYQNLIANVMPNFLTKAKSSTASMGDAEREVWDVAQMQLRGNVKDSVGNAVHKEAVQRPPSGQPQQPLGGTTLAQLKNTVDKLNTQFRSTGLIDGSSYDKDKARAATAAIDAIHEEMAKFVGGKESKARAEFSRYLTIQDRFTMGQTAVTGNLSEDPETYKTLMETYNGFKTQDEKSAMAEGFASGLKNQILNKGFYRTMANLIGDTGEVPEMFSAVGTNANKVELLQAMIGKEGADDLVKMYKTGRYREAAATRLIDTLGRKAQNPAAFTDAVRQGDGLLIADGFRSGQNAAWSNAFLGSAQRFLAKRGPKQGEIGLSLLSQKGPALQESVADYLRAYARPTNVPAGRGAAPALSGQEDENQIGPMDALKQTGASIEALLGLE